MPYISSVTEYPANTALTTVSRVEGELGITGANATLDPIIDEVSDTIRQMMGVDFIGRARITEDVESYGRIYLRLTNRPLLVVHSINELGADNSTSLLDASEYTIGNNIPPRVRSLRGGWEWSAAQRGGIVHSAVAGTERPRWRVDHTCGYLMPGDDISADTNISFTNATDTISTTGTFPLLVAGDRITVSGAANSANNGTFTVVSRTSSAIVIGSGGTLVDEAAGASVSIGVQTLPQALQRAAIDFAKFRYLHQQNDPSVIEESAAGIGSVKYGSTTVPSSVMAVVNGYKRPML